MTIRRARVSPLTQQRIRQLLDLGLMPQAIANKVGVSRATVNRYKKYLEGLEKLPEVEQEALSVRQKELVSTFMAAAVEMAPEVLKALKYQIETKKSVAAIKLWVDLVGLSKAREAKENHMEFTWTQIVNQLKEPLDGEFVDVMPTIMIESGEENQGG